MPRRRVGALVAVVATCLFLGLTLLVAIGATQAVDDAAKDFFRPDDMWSTPQFRAGDVITGGKPLHVVVVATVLTGWRSVRRATVRPIALVGTALLVTAAVTWITKRVVDRPDTHGFDTGGSYSSGHVAVLLVTLGCLTLLAARTRWWMWAATFVAVCVMAVCLLVQATHWLTDIVGGALLGTAVLACATVVTSRSRDRQRTRTDPAS